MWSYVWQHKISNVNRTMHRKWSNIKWQSASSHLKGLSPIICACLESPKVALHAGSYCKVVAGTAVELWQHKISNDNRTTENGRTSSLCSQSLERVVTHYLCMFRISKGCSSCCKVVAGTAVELWQHKISNVNGTIDFKPLQPVT